MNLGNLVPTSSLLTSVFCSLCVTVMTKLLLSTRYFVHIIASDLYGNPSGQDLCLYVADEETEAQREQFTCPRSQKQQTRAARLKSRAACQ